MVPSYDNTHRRTSQHQRGKRRRGSGARRVVPWPPTSSLDRDPAIYFVCKISGRPCVPGKLLEEPGTSGRLRRTVSTAAPHIGPVLLHLCPVSSQLSGHDVLAQRPHEQASGPRTPEHRRVRARSDISLNRLFSSIAPGQDTCTYRQYVPGRRRRRRGGSGGKASCLLPSHVKSGPDPAIYFVRKISGRSCAPGKLLKEPGTSGRLRRTV